MSKEVKRFFALRGKNVGDPKAGSALGFSPRETARKRGHVAVLLCGLGQMFAAGGCSVSEARACWDVIDGL